MKPLAADIETDGLENLHRNPDFFRIGGVEDPVTGETRITDDPKRYISWLNAAPMIDGHNFVGFDALALAKWHPEADYEAICAKVLDSLIVELHVDPVAAKGAQKNHYYRLGETSVRYGGPDKTDNLPKLAKKHGGFGSIPTDNEEYLSYLRGDLAAQRGLSDAQARLELSAADRAYIAREHAVATVMGRVTLNGFRVDVEENERRYEAGQARLEASKIMMHEKYGMPLGDGKPHTTNLGKAAFREALLGTGIRADVLSQEWPVNKDGSLNMSKDVLTRFSEMLTGRNARAVQIIDTIKAMNGERTVYGNIRDHTHVGQDGIARIHPEIRAEQASGRWSLTKPGVTVLGKRGGKAVERGVLLPDIGDMLVCLDADQVDARVIAAECQDPAYMAIFQDPSRDLHSEVAYMIFKRPECKAEMERNNGRCDCEWREKSKACTHGWSYGQQPKGNALAAGVPLEISQQFDRGMTEAFPVLADWRASQRVLAGAMDYGQVPPEGDTYRVLNNAFGRRVRVERRRAFTQATAQIGQSGTRDIMAQGLLGMPFEVRNRVRALIHDEYVLSVPADGAEQYGKDLAKSLAFEFRGVPITFGSSKAGSNWGDCYLK